MFCPNCGANNSTEQKFCRSCGLNLEKTAESLLEQIPSAESAKLLKQQRNLERFGSVAFGGLVLVLVVGIQFLLFYIFAKLVLTGGNVVGGIILMAFIVFAALTLVYVFLTEELREKKQNAKAVLQNQVEAKDTAKLLEGKPFEPIPSVIENTTDLLFVENRTKKLE